MAASGARREPQLWRGAEDGGRSPCAGPRHPGQIRRVLHVKTEEPAEFPPQVRYHTKVEVEQYAAKARSVVVRHTSDHRVIAVLEIVSAGNKSSRRRFEAFLSKTEKLLLAGIHLLVVDLFPPGPRDPQGVHAALWERFTDSDFALPADRPLTLAAYIGGPIPEAFVEPTGVGADLHNMPLFLSPEVYISTPLDATYASAWETMPLFWREALTTPGDGA